MAAIFRPTFVRALLRHLGLFAAMIAPIAHAQRLVDPANPLARELIALIDDGLGRGGVEGSLNCDVDSLKPQLNFALRWHAGYRAGLSLRQFPTEAVKLKVVFRVTSMADGRRYHFWQSFTLPAGPRSRRQEAQIDGGFFLGEGEYRVDWLLIDPQGRACRENWEVALKPKRREREMALPMEPGTALPIILEWEGTSSEPARPYRVAVVLHVAPLFPRSLRLSSFDQSFLITMLTSALEKTPFRESSVYAVNLDKQKVLFEANELDAPSFNRLLDAMEEIELGTIGIDEYWNPEGNIDLLAGIVNRELTSENPPDAVIFIGPTNRQTVRFPRDRVENVSGRTPQFFYLHLDYYSWRFPWADTIEHLIRTQRGRVFSIHNPRALAKALQEIAKRLAEVGPAASVFPDSRAHLPDGDASGTNHAQAAPPDDASETNGDGTKNPTWNAGSLP